ncbi:MAG TPA: deoxyribonuclease IV [Methanoculleus sp.]|mgnify:CR=1 FL=1|nr:deoxyribonuclease IV [Methanoculleus sp.]
MVRVGCHVSIAGSVDRAIERAIERDCDTFQIFSSNPRGWKSRELKPAEIDAFRTSVRESGLDPAVAHMPYLPNLATPKPDIYQRSVETLARELSRCRLLGIPYLVTHLGSHLGEGREGGIARFVSGMDRALAEAGGTTMLLLENTAGTAHSIGGTFEDIAAILTGSDHSDRLGVCFDTCHAFAAGYDIATPAGLAATLEALDASIGNDRVRLVHCNDAKGACGSRLDRHEHIGLGAIGEEGFRRILHTPLFRGLPLICETPVDERRSDTDNIRVVRDLAEK